MIDTDRLQVFVDEYEEIIDTLNNLHDDITNKELKQYILELIEMFEGDYKNQKEECENVIMEEDRKDLECQRIERDKIRL